jgi:hypothetical protein
MKKLSLAVAVLAAGVMLTQPIQSVFASSFSFMTDLNVTVYSVQNENEISINEFEQYTLTSVESAELNWTLFIDSTKNLDESIFTYTITVDRIASGKVSTKGYQLTETSFTGNDGRKLIEVMPNGREKETTQNYWTYDGFFSAELSTDKPGEYLVTFSYTLTDGGENTITESLSSIVKFFQVPPKKK